MTYELLNPSDWQHAKVTKDNVADFLFEHLDQYGDKREDIMKCIEYALSEQDGKGGFITVAYENADHILGAVIINDTGMAGFIPEHILVYIAVHGDARGKGVGKGLMNNVMDRVSGDIALHVEPDNPARYLYENLGFTNKYLEMRWKNNR